MNRQNKQKSNKRRLPAALLMAALLLAFCYWQNNGLMVTRLTHTSARLPASFDGYVIAQISDLHNKSFGRAQQKLLRQLQAARPDLIVVTGDLIDRRRAELQPALTLLRGCLEIAPVYYVTGNHEAGATEYPQLAQSLQQAGVALLDGRVQTLTRGAAEIELLGLPDPAFAGAEASLAALAAQSDAARFRILLAHRPELLPSYAQSGVDLVFSGHAHGGQFRLPGAGGLVAPGQGLLPAFTSGAYALGRTTMIVSRGLGNSIVPLRLFNRPELILLTLRCQ